MKAIDRNIETIRVRDLTTRKPLDRDYIEAQEYGCFRNDLGEEFKFGKTRTVNNNPA